MTDNGPQFVSTDYKKFASNDYKQFASKYGMENVTSSPYWPQGNDKAEAVGKIAKLMYQKNKDIHLALLDYRNTQNRDRNTHQVKDSYPDTLEAYFL